MGEQPAGIRIYIYREGATLMAKKKRKTLERSNDKPAAVKMEMRAAELILVRGKNKGRINKYRCTSAEWLAHADCLNANRSPDVTEDGMPTKGVAGWLANEIATHDEQQSALREDLIDFATRTLSRELVTVSETEYRIGFSDLVSEQTRHDVAASVDRHDRAEQAGVAALAVQVATNLADGLGQTMQVRHPDGSADIVLPPEPSEQPFPELVRDAEAWPDATTPQGDAGELEHQDEIVLHDAVEPASEARINERALEDDDAISPPIATLGPEIAASLSSETSLGYNIVSCIDGESGEPLVIAGVSRWDTAIEAANALDRLADDPYHDHLDPDDYDIVPVSAPISPEVAASLRADSARITKMTDDEIVAEVALSPPGSTWAPPVERPLAIKSRGNADSTGDTCCVCGHAVEEHGNDPLYPGSTACSECPEGDCIAFESEG
jgi:hypothetical protein